MEQSCKFTLVVTFTYVRRTTILFVAYVDYIGFDKSPGLGNRFSRRDNLLTKQSSSSKVGKYCQKFAD